jgi:hypothetical protein
MSVPSWSVTVSLLAPSTTCSFVTMRPSESTTKPVPVASPAELWPPPPNGDVASSAELPVVTAVIWTTLGDALR